MSPLRTVCMTEVLHKWRFSVGITPVCWKQCFRKPFVFGSHLNNCLLVTPERAIFAPRHKAYISLWWVVLIFFDKRPFNQQGTSIPMQICLQFCLPLVCQHQSTTRENISHSLDISLKKKKVTWIQYPSPDQISGYLKKKKKTLWTN